VRIVKPNTIDDSNFVSSNVAEDDAPLWDAGDTYTTGDEVMLEHVVYKAAAAIGAGVDPRLSENRTQWPIVGATNRWRMFDMTRGTEIQTTNADSVVVEFDLTRIYSSLSLFGLVAREVRVEIIDGSNGTVFDETYSLTSTLGITYFFAWFYTPPITRTQLVTTDLPYYPGARVRVSILFPDTTVKVGKLVIGRAQDLGCTSYGTNVRFLDFSRRDRDEFGNLILVPRRRVSERTFHVKVDSERLASVEAAIKDFGTVPGVFIGSPNHEVTNIFGLPIDFNSDYSFKKTNYTLKVQEY
jgi:hypothetical protein